MMSPEKQSYDDELVIAYLLGTVSPNEADRLVELSIADDEFAARLSAVENDLVDAYVRGELSGGRLEQFRTVYLASPRRREKVAAAEVLAERIGAPVIAARAAIAFPKWAFAAAACLLAGVGSVLLFRAPWPQSPPVAQQVPQARESSPPAPQPSPPAPRGPLTVALVLPPQLRGAASIPVLNLPPAADTAQFLLELESDEFSAYRAALRNPATNQVVWRSGALRSEHRAEGRVIDASVPASLLQPQNYTFELTGVSGAGGNEFIGSYSFRVVK
jgi:hypothetical protein